MRNKHKTRNKYATLILNRNIFEGKTEEMKDFTQLSLRYIL